MRAVSPVLLVSDVVRSRDYYSDALGFRLNTLWGEPPTFCMARRDGVEVMLSQVSDNPQPNGKIDGQMDAYIWVDDVTNLFKEFDAKGALIESGPTDRPYEAREIEVRDPDGHRLVFAQDMAGKA